VRQVKLSHAEGISQCDNVALYLKQGCDKQLKLRKNKKIAQTLQWNFRLTDQTRPGDDSERLKQDTGSKLGEQI
jgi:hypothetical protein